jgi:hypothetical protein
MCVTRQVLQRLHRRVSEERLRLTVQDEDELVVTFACEHSVLRIVQLVARPRESHRASYTSCTTAARVCSALRARVRAL